MLVNSCQLEKDVCSAVLEKEPCQREPRLLSRWRFSAQLRPGWFSACGAAGNSQRVWKRSSLIWVCLFLLAVPSDSFCEMFSI